MAYKFQSGDATLSGSVTLVSYQDLLFEADASSNIGTAAKAVGIVFSDRLTASVGLSGSAIYSNNFYGNGSNLTGVPGSTTSKVTGSNLSGDLQLVLVQNAGTTETLAVDNAGAIAFNPGTNLLSSTGAIVAGTSLSASTSLGGKSVLLGQNGFIGAAGDTDLIKLATNTVTINGALTGSDSLSGLDLTLNGGSWAADGDLAAAELSGSDGLKGKSVLLGANGFIGLIGDTNLLKLESAQLTVDGIVSGSDALSGKSVLLGQSGQIGAVGDTDLITLTTNSVVIAGALSGSGTLSAAGAVQLDGADDGVAFVAADNLYFRDAGSGQMRRDSFSDVMEVAAGTVTTTGIENSSGVLSFALSSLTEAAVATTDYVVFADANDSDSIKKEAVDDLMEIGMSLLSEVPMAIASDFLVFSDATDSNKGARIKMKSFIAAAADGTSITSSNGVLSVVGAQNIDIDTLGNASRQLTSAGMNYATASIATNVTYTLPVSPSTGDIVYIKLAGVTSGKHAVISGSAKFNQTIDGESAITASSAYAGISLCLVAQGKWRIF
jgi:hypothetical protein